MDLVLCACCSGAKPAHLGGWDLPGGLRSAAGCGCAQHLEAVEIGNLPHTVPLPQL